MLEAEPTLRDLDRWKDRIELSLDSRQVFFLFFGSAVVACLVFVLGVLVGERVARTSAPATSGPDPLAALDALGSEHDPGLGAIGSAPRSLTVTAQALAAQPPLAFHDSLTAHGRTVDGPLADASRKTLDAAATPSAASDPPAVAPTTSAPGVTATGKGRYTLQLSSFEEKGEAERFARRLAADGYSPVVYPAEVPGKGTWYRVRVGEYATHREAVDAKSDLEHDEQVTAYVARLGTASKTSSSSSGSSTGSSSSSSLSGSGAATP